MNGKQAKLLASIARRLSPPRHSSVVTRSGYVPANRRTLRRRTAGWPFTTITNTGYRKTYQNFKRIFKTIPRPQRARWLRMLNDAIEV